MLKTKNKGIVIALLNAALIIAPVQMSLASTSNHGTNNQKVKPCQHAKKSNHSSKGHNKTIKSSHHVQKMDMSHVEKMSDMNEMEQHACQCSDTCADCCAGHATVALNEVEFYQFTKADSVQPAIKIFQYKQISLPIENPPPMA